MTEQYLAIGARTLLNQSHEERRNALGYARLANQGGVDGEAKMIKWHDRPHAATGVLSVARRPV